MAGWEWIALVYFSYLATVALAGPRFAQAGKPVLATAAIAWGLAAVSARPSAAVLPAASAIEVALPGALLLVGYWLSGRFFVGPMFGVERWLLRVDRRFLDESGVLGWYRGAPAIVHDYFELAYLLVYPMLPLGAIVLATSGHAESVGRYWTIVLLAEFASYGVLPWVQTRPPRALEPIRGDSVDRVRAGGVVRSLNVALLDRASIQVNTFPSGHAAGAVAVALAVSASMPLAGAAFAVLAGSIVVATVLGRYHYLVDSLVGTAVAFAAWGIVTVVA